MWSFHCGTNIIIKTPIHLNKQQKYERDTTTTRIHPLLSDAQYGCVTLKEMRKRFGI